MNKRTKKPTLFLTILLWSAAALGQGSAAAPAKTNLLTVSSEGANSLKLTAADLAKLPHRSITW